MLNNEFNDWGRCTRCGKRHQGLPLRLRCTTCYLKAQTEAVEEYVNLRLFGMRRIGLPSGTFTLDSTSRDLLKKSGWHYE